MPIHEGTIKLTNRKIKSILGDAEKSARAINLIYVDDSQPGITRIKRDGALIYFHGNKKVRKKSVLERIKKLVIPPAWEDVWICSLDNGHLQATGKDARGRKQYRYHPSWNSLRNHTKFYRLHDFGRALPAIRQQLKKDLSLPGLPAEKILAAAVSLMEQTSIRVGNALYEKLYGSFGLTTLKNKHVKVTGDKMCFMFKGKKGITHNISIRNKRLAKIVKNCRDIPGKELFQYYDHEGHRKAIDSGMINTYLKSITGENFTAKDFRTWTGTVRAISAFQELGQSETQAEVKRHIVAALDSVAAHLGNTRTVCKKYYVHPAILELYEKNLLHKYLNNIEEIEGGKSPVDLAPEEKLLMMILEKENLVCASS